jgi:hypothetical protein
MNKSEKSYTEKLILRFDFDQLIKAHPETFIHAGVEYAQNPFTSLRPLIRIDRDKRIAVETDYRSKEDVVWQM